MAEPAEAIVDAPATLQDDEARLLSFGYQQQLRRAIRRFGSFAVSFGALSITTGMFLLFPYVISTAGPAGIWTWPISTVGTILVALIFAEMATKVPLTGYSYQWSSRLANAHVGWFVGWAAFIGFGIGVAGTAFGVTPFFLQFLAIDVTPTNIIIGGTVLIAILAFINVVGIRLTISITNVLVVTEIVGSVGAAAVLLIFALVHPVHGPDFLANTNNTGSGFGYFGGAFILAFLLGAWSLAGWEATADLAEETVNPVATIPRAMIQCVVVVGICGMVILLGFTMGIPDVQAMLASSVPMTYIMQYWFGATGTDVILVFVLASMFGCELAILAAATRLVFSLSRDNMLPASTYLRRVSPRFRTPHLAIVTIAIFAVLFYLIGTVISPTVLTYAITASAVGYNLVYLATCVLYLLRRHTLDASERNAFTLGRWGTPIGVIAVAWLVFVCGLLTLSPSNRPVGITTLVLMLIALLWYVFGLRRRLVSGAGGPPTGLAQMALRR